MNIPLIAWVKKFTMYRLMLYYLIFLVAISILLSLFGLLPYQAIDILSLAIFFTLACWLINNAIARLMKVTPNVESQFITALILTLIVGPMPLIPNIGPALLFTALAMGSKYVIAWRRRHIFNPAGFGVFATALLIGQGASWWIGSTIMLPFVILGGLFVLVRTKRTNMVISFLTSYIILFFLVGLFRGRDIVLLISQLRDVLLLSPLIFFSLVMLIEPLTSPAMKKFRVSYAIFTAFILILAQTFFSSYPYTLELSLLIGNIFTRMINFDPRFLFTLREKKEIAPNIIQFFFTCDERVNHVAGQYLEWTLAHAHPDSRGMRRYFTISSSPTESDYILTTKFSEKSSSFKSALKALEPGQTLTAHHLEGEFVLPKDPDVPCVFIAGGIGVTPFRSMIKYMIDSKSKRPITLFCSNRTASDIVFKDLFDQAEKEFGLKTVYTITDDIPTDWKGRTGFIDAKMIEEEVPDYKQRIFYISGPEPMVEAFEKMIAEMGVADNNIKRDFFPGYTDTHQAKK
jgi:ferredoxin-NADP reductase